MIDIYKKAKRVLVLTGAAVLAILAVELAFTSFNLGFAVLAALGLGLIVYGCFFERLIGIKWLNACIIIFGAAYLGLAVFLGVYGNSDDVTYREDAVVVLGAGIRGERVTRLLALRLDRAAEYAGQNPAALVIVTGGQGAGEDITEALAMERYLIDKGVSPVRIIKEQNSTSTYENLLFAKEILDKRFSGRAYTAAVITNDFHIYRAAFLAKALGYDATHCHAKILPRNIPVNYARETLAVLKTWVAGR